MRLHVNSVISAYYDIVDLDKNERIKLCQWANDVTGEYRVLKLDEKGCTIFNDLTEEFELEYKQGNIIFIRKNSYIYITVHALINLYNNLVRRVKRLWHKMKKKCFHKK